MCNTLLKRVFAPVKWRNHLNWCYDLSTGRPLSLPSGWVGTYTGRDEWAAIPGPRGWPLDCCCPKALEGTAYAVDFNGTPGAHPTIIANAVDKRFELIINGEIDYTAAGPWRMRQVIKVYEYQKVSHAYFDYRRYHRIVAYQEDYDPAAVPLPWFPCRLDFDVAFEYTDISVDATWEDQEVNSFNTPIGPILASGSGVNPMYSNVWDYILSGALLHICQSVWSTGAERTYVASGPTNRSNNVGFHFPCS